MCTKPTRSSFTLNFATTIRISGATGHPCWEGMLESGMEFPDKVFTPVRTLEEGEFVVVHGRVRLKSNMPEIALVHIFRFEGDLIIEEWEVAQEVPGEPPNNNGMF